MAKKATDKATILSDKEAEFRKHNFSRNKILGFLRWYKEAKGDPLSYTDALCLVRSCIDFYYDHLIGLIQTGPYQKIHALAVKHVVGKKFDLRNEPVETYRAFKDEASRCLYDLVSGQYRKKIKNEELEYAKEGLSRYLHILSAIHMIKAGQSSCELPSFMNMLYDLIYLTFTDIYIFVHFYQTNEIKKLINSEISARGPNKRWKTTNELNQEAVNIIYDLWENDDPRLHGKIARDVVGEINEPILVPIIKELLRKYPNKDFNAAEMEEYKKELQIKSRGKVANAGTVMKLIFQRALVKKRANDPQKGTRKFKEYRKE
ncbi:hypothetical protein [Desulfovibrio sp. DV]|uniref:hypothetical protein n=1 Tax=Desulfovibrio sp. DV TaxID=1844708 RepID=UPI000A736FF7|nr:hypothetical protein [Desulfovibrio sp. DV]